MNPEKQRLAISKACGWISHKGNWNRSNSGNDAFGIRPFSEIWTEWYSQNGRDVLFEDLPDYLNDLNAMHKAEKTLKILGCWRNGRALDQGQTMEIYLFELYKVIKFSHRADLLVCATAAQRAEAFLKTLNLWE